MTEIGRGDEKAMKCLLRKIESLEPHLIGGLKGLINERNELVELFNSDFKTEVRDMLTDIDDGFLSGECRFESRLK
jgi:hypothetical protein